jgi:hypothetical protein
VDDAHAEIFVAAVAVEFGAETVNLTGEQSGLLSPQRPLPDLLPLDLSHEAPDGQHQFTLRRAIQLFCDEDKLGPSPLDLVGQDGEVSHVARRRSIA